MVDTVINNRTDPIRDRYFRPLEHAENALRVFFYTSAVLSLLAFLVPESEYPTLFAVIQTLFVMSVIAYFSLGLIIHLLLSPKAQVKRFEDFVTHAHGVSTGHQATAGYYNSSAGDVPTRIAAQVLENSFYSADTANEMAKNERIKVLAYAVPFIIIVLNRNADLAFITLAAQLVFSEQILARWFRLEWLRIKFQDICDELYRNFQAKSQFQMLGLTILGRYEIAKAIAATTLSEKIFLARKEENDKEWNKIRAALGI